MVETINLPKPQRDLPFPLMKAFEKRRSKRKWNTAPVTHQQISNLLWAGCGISVMQTKKAKQKRTSPSVTNSQEIKLYIALKEGLYLYNEIDHQLILKSREDIREYIGTQKMMKSAPIGIIFVSDYSKLKMYLSTDNDEKWFISGTDSGFISQNIYLYCASAGLSTTIIGLVDREKLELLMDLSHDEKVIYTQVIGNEI